jgi:hypothetical protein
LDSSRSGGGTKISSLLQTYIWSARNDLAAAWFIAGNFVGATGAGATHHQAAAGEAKTHLGCFWAGAGSAKALILLAANVFITSYQTAAAGFIAGNFVVATHMGTSDTCAFNRI